MNNQIPIDPMLEARLARLQQRSPQTRRPATGTEATSAHVGSAPPRTVARATTARQQPHTRRPSPATGTKIATTGFAAATIFGMVTAMTWSQHAIAAKNAATTVPPTAAPTTAATVAPKVVVRVHHVKAGSAAAVKAATPAKKKTGTVRSNAPTSVKKPVVAPPVQKAPVSTCTATSKVACP